MQRIVIHIYGRVQGVFFRHTARVHAEELHVTGWARNEDDGSVKMLVEGDEAALNKFLEWCRVGPPLARVDDLKADWHEATGEFKAFEII